MTSATVADQSGPKSGTSWAVTSSPLFSILGKENTSPNAIMSYRSPATSLRGLVVTTDEPICSLHILLSTESNGGGDNGSQGGAWHHPDDGLPHTLEHLVFLGSQTHPHKGILDKLANRCMADGTNAWTATDHTAYTLSTAGSEGAINLMPIFADHVLFPTLTDSGFVTEVHHVNGRGENKGVVYCEMQGRENSEGSLVDRAIMDLIYPHSSDGQSTGYSAETGGKMSNLRTLDVDKVRRYHEEYYTPDNTILILTGNVKAEDFFGALDEVEALILKRQPERKVVDRPGARAGRPWINSSIPDMVVAENAVGVYPPHNTNGVGTGASKPLFVNFPSEDESRGTISIAWRGPPYTSRSIWMHLSLLWDYLTDSAASPLQLAFVENDDPICADVGPAQDVFTEGYHQLWFQECDVDRMDEVVSLFFDVIAAQAGLATKDGESFDLARMSTVIRRYRRRVLAGAESRPTGSIIDGIVRNFLYGPRSGESNGEEKCTSPQEEMSALHSDVDSLPYLNEAEGKLADASYWQGLMKEYILDRPMAVVFGKPSAAMSKEISDGEKEREAQQARDLGVKGLIKLGKTLDDAMDDNEQPIPEEILTSLPVPDLEKVPSIPCFTARLSPSEKELKLGIVEESVRDVKMEDAEAIVAKLKGESGSTVNVPFHADLTHIDSAFVFAAVGIDTTPLSQEQRLYLPILDEILFKLPATFEGGETLSKEEFVNKLHDETVSYSSGAGLLGGSIPQMSYVSIQAESGANGSGLATAFHWIRSVLYLTNITSESVKTAVQKLISEIPPQIRYGPAVVSTMASEMNYDPEKSNTVASNCLRQKPFLSKIYEGMESGNDAVITDVVKELEGIRHKLFQTSNMHPFVAANLRGIPNLLNTLVTSLSRTDGAKVDAPGRLIDNVSAFSVLRPEQKDAPGGQGAVCSLSALESGFLNIIAPGINAYDPNRASLLVAIEYLTALEGDFWVKLRGAGLTYSYSIGDSTDSQLLRFSLFKCTDIPAAFETASNIITDYASGKAKVSSVGLENAKASLAYQIISGRSSKLSAATSSFVRTFKGEKMDYDRHLLSRILEVSPNDVMHALITHLVPIFDPSSKLAIACPTNKLDAVYEYFTKRGWTNLKKVPEEKLFSAFVGNTDEGEDTERESMSCLPEKVPGMSMFLPGAFAAQFRCACPKCDR